MSEARVKNNSDKAMSLRRNMLWNSFGSLTRTICKWLFTLVVVRFSDGFDAAGILALAMSISNLVNPIAESRLRVYYVTEQSDMRPVANYMGIRVVSTLIALVVGVMYAVFSSDGEAIVIISLYVVYQMILNYTEGFHAVQQRAMRMDLIGISYAVEGVLSLTVFTISMYVFHSLLIAIVGVIVVALAVAIAYDAPSTSRFAAIHPRFDFEDIFKTLVRLSPLVAVAITFNIVGLVPRQALADSFGDHALGVYAAVATPVIVVQVAAGYIYTPIIGKLVELFHADKRRVLFLQLKIIGMFLVIAALAALVFAVMGEQILVILFGEEIRPYSFLIQPAVILSLLTAMTWFLNDLLFGIRSFWGCFIGGLSAAVVTLVVTPRLTALFELNGPSMIGIVSYLVSLMIMTGFYVAAYLKDPEPLTE